MKQKDIRMIIRNRLLKDLQGRQEQQQNRAKARVQPRIFMDLPSEDISFRFFMFLDSRIICA